MKLFKQIIIVSSCFFVALVTYGQQNDYYRGGMAVNFSENKLTFQTFVALLKLFNEFGGLRSINLGN